MWGALWALSPQIGKINVKPTNIMKYSITMTTKRAWDAIAMGIPILCVAVAVSQAWAAGAIRNAIWVHDRLYGTVGTPTTFKSPPPQSLDVIYSFANSGLKGQRSVAEAAPGDPDFNGGRWKVMGVSFTAQGLDAFDKDDDGNVDMEITNAEDLWSYVDSGDLLVMDTGIRFECPLLP